MQIEWSEAEVLKLAGIGTEAEEGTREGVGTGCAIGSNPIAFTVDGQQRIAISADRVLYVFGL